MRPLEVSRSTQRRAREREILCNSTKKSSRGFRRTQERQNVYTGTFFVFFVHTAVCFASICVSILRSLILSRRCEQQSCGGPRPPPTAASKGALPAAAFVPVHSQPIFPHLTARKRSLTSTTGMTSLQVQYHSRLLTCWNHFAWPRKRASPDLVRGACVDISPLAAQSLLIPLDLSSSAVLASFRAWLLVSCPAMRAPCEAGSQAILSNFMAC